MVYDSNIQNGNKYVVLTNSKEGISDNINNCKGYRGLVNDFLVGLNYNFKYAAFRKLPMYITIESECVSRLCTNMVSKCYNAISTYSCSVPCSFIELTSSSSCDKISIYLGNRLAKECASYVYNGIGDVFIYYTTTRNLVGSNIYWFYPVNKVVGRWKWSELPINSICDTIDHTVSRKTYNKHTEPLQQCICNDISGYPCLALDATSSDKGLDLGCSKDGIMNRNVVVDNYWTTQHYYSGKVSNTLKGNIALGNSTLTEDKIEECKTIDLSTETEAGDKCLMHFAAARQGCAALAHMTETGGAAKGLKYRLWGYDWCLPRHRANTVRNVTARFENDNSTAQYYRDEYRNLVVGCGISKETAPDTKLCGLPMAVCIAPNVTTYMHCEDLQSFCNKTKSLDSNLGGTVSVYNIHNINTPTITHTVNITDTVISNNITESYNISSIAATINNTVCPITTTAIPYTTALQSSSVKP